MNCPICGEPVLLNETTVDATAEPWRLADAVGQTHVECADEALALALDGEWSLRVDLELCRED